MGANSPIGEEAPHSDTGNSGAGVGATRNPFSEGEKILVDHETQLYEARVKKVEVQQNEWKLLVHYLGWSKSWDEWITLDRSMKHTAENVEKMNELFKKAQILEKNTKGGRGNLNKSKPANDNKIDKEDMRHYGGRSKKRKHESGAEDKDSEFAEKLVKIHFPPALKKQLVDDWECVTQLSKLVRLPCNPNIDDILSSYLEYRVKKDNTIAEGVGEILKGLRDYFDKALPLMLLYKMERLQYQEFIKDNLSPSAVYGAEHLLRLFVKLPELLSYINMEEDALTQVHQGLLDFLRFLNKNQAMFFVATYDESTCAKESEEEQSN